MKRIPLLENLRIKVKINEDRTDAVRGCVMLGIEPNNAVWADILSKVKDEDLYVEGDSFGKENEPHLTVLYGLDLGQGVRKQIMDHYSADFPKIKIMASGVSLFENPGKEYDVLKFDIEVTPELAEMNKFLTENFEYSNDYPEYHPHATIAYVKKGMGKEYVDKFECPIEFRIKNLMWSEKDYKFFLTKTILGPIATCRSRADGNLTMFDPITYEVAQNQAEGNSATK